METLHHFQQNANSYLNVIYENDKILSTINVNEFFDYQNTDNKFDLSEYEGNIENNLVSNVANDLIIKIIDIQND